MRAITYHAPYDVRVEAIADARLLEDGDALIQVEVAGLCGSDLHVWHGRETGLDAGTVMGHECLGRIVEAGRGVTRWRIDDRVVCPFTTSCGACFFCRRGLTARCTQGRLFGWVERGAGLQGTQAELVRVPLADATLMAAPADVPPEVALLLADVLPTGWHAARMGDVEAGSVVAVIGCGPVGLCAVLAARERGTARVFAVDGVPERRELARQWGAEPVDPTAGAARDAVRVATENRGADAVLECVGSEAAGRLAFELVRAGGVISTVGVHHEARLAFSPGEAYDRNLTYRIGRCPARAYGEELAPVAARHAEKLARIVTHRAPLERGPELYRVFDEKRDGCLKVVFDMTA